MKLSKRPTDNIVAEMLFLTATLQGHLAGTRAADVKSENGRRDHNQHAYS